MARIVGKSEIQNKVEQKQELEVALSHKVYDAFNRPPSIGAIRATVLAGLASMHWGPPLALDRAMAEEDKLQL